MTSDAAYRLVYTTGVSQYKLEKIISGNSHDSYYYAVEILKGRFGLGEKLIGKDAYYAYWYAFYVLKCKFELGEEEISKDGFYSYIYAIDILKSRFKLGESSMGKENCGFYYCQNVIGYNHD